jgi:hypothetical protein
MPGTYTAARSAGLAVAAGGRAALGARLAMEVDEDGGGLHLDSLIVCVKYVGIEWLW